MFLLPFPPDLAATHGGARVTAELIEMLSRKHDVLVLYLEPTGSRPITRPPGKPDQLVGVPVRATRNRRKRTWHRVWDGLRWFLWDIPDWVKESWSDAMEEAIAARTPKFRPHVVHCEFHVMGQYIPLLRRVAPEASCIITEHEVGVVAAVDHGNERTGLTRRLASSARQRAWARFEKRALSQADAVVTFTEADRAVVSHLVGPSGPECVCIPFQLRADAPYGDARKMPVSCDLLFVGNFRHPPNFDAAMRLVTTIFPAIREAEPAVSLFIVGPDPPEELLKAKSPGVTITGWVESPQRYLAGAKLVLAPLRQGGGMRVKVVEACAAGKALIASDLAVEGLGLRPALDFVLANSDQEFIESTIALLGDTTARERLGAAALEWALRTQTSDEWLSKYEDLYSRL